MLTGILRVIVAATTLLGLGPNLAVAATEEGAAVVRIAPAQRVRMAPQRWLAGTVVSRVDARLAAEVPGRLVSVAELGQTVAEGGVVARIDDTFIKLKIEELEAAQVREQARLALIESEVKRLARLARENNTAQMALDKAFANREVARSELHITRVRLEQAREERGRHSLRAPFAGVVTERLMQGGEWASVGDAVVRFIDNQTLEVQTRAPLQALDYVRVGDRLPLGVRGQEIPGHVRALVAAGDERSRLLDLRVVPEDGALTVGQAVRVAIPTDRARSVLAVPRDALVLRRAGAAVFRVGDGGKAERIAVETGVANGTLIEVRAVEGGDLQPGDRVVIRGGERLRPGQAVHVLDGE